MRTIRARRLPVFSFVVLVGSVAAAQAGPAAAWIPDALRAWQPGLEMIHAGRGEEGLEWILDRQRQRPEDACGYYFAAQAYLNFDLENPNEEDRNSLGNGLLDQGLDLDGGPAGDVASRFCRGAMHGLRAGQRVMKGSYLSAALDGKKMRRTMLDLVEEHTEFVDCKFWLGTYDYYAAILPKYVKFFKTLLFLPSGDLDRGIAELDDATRVGIVEKYNAHWILSEVYGEQEQPNEKRALLQRFHAAYPDDVDAVRALARNLAFVEPRELEQGVEVLQRFIERLEATKGSHVQPRLFDSRLALGRIHSLSHDNERALPELQQALALGRNDERQGLRVGELLIRTLNGSGRHAEAVELFRDLEQLHPDAQRLKNLEQETFRYDEASSRLTLALAPARRLVWEGKIEEAEAKYKELLIEHHGAAQIHLWMAEMYFEAAQWTRSEARFRKVVERAPGMPTFAVPHAQIRLGQICDLTNRRSEAKKHYRAARDTAGLDKRYVRAAEYFLKNRYSRG